MPPVMSLTYSTLVSIYIYCYIISYSYKLYISYSWFVFLLDSSDLRKRLNDNPAPAVPS